MQEVRVIRTPDGGTIAIPGRSGLPSSPQELEALRMQRTEIGDQIGRLRSRRGELEEQLQRADGAGAKSAIAARIAEVEARKLALEGQMDGLNEQIANAPAIAMIPVQTLPPGGTFERALAREIVPITAFFTLFFLAPLAFAFARLLWKRGNAAASRPALADQAVMTRLEQLQTSVDAMSLEVERISEGQRYLTKLNADKEKAALPR